MGALLSLLAGPDALALVRDRGLRGADVDIVPAASGGPKWLVLAGLDRFVFGELLQVPRRRPLHLIGSSIGAWRLACLAQRDPAAALARGHHAYIEQRYPPKPSPRLVSEVSAAILLELLGKAGAAEILAHPWARLHVITARCRGPLASERPWLQGSGVALAAVANLAARRALATSVRRVVFHAGGDRGPFAALTDFPTEHRTLDLASLGPALLASGSIPLVLQGMRVPGAPGVHRDGGLVDYHLDLDFGPGQGLVLYPHFYPHVVPGWLDKSLPWRRASARRFRRALIVAPSAEFVARLPHGKLPDRRDFYRLGDAERMRAWTAVVAASAALGDELGELIATGKLASAVRPLASVWSS
jgi:hypothetical protein